MTHVKLVGGTFLIFFLILRRGHTKVPWRLCTAKDGLIDTAIKTASSGKPYMNNLFTSIFTLHPEFLFSTDFFWHVGSPNLVIKILSDTKVCLFRLSVVFLGWPTIKILCYCGYIWYQKSYLQCWKYKDFQSKNYPLEIVIFFHSPKQKFAKCSVCKHLLNKLNTKQSNMHTASQEVFTASLLPYMQ